MTLGKGYYLTPTLKFSIAGIFIPGFSAALIFVVQMGIGLLGIECSNSWTILWVLTTASAVTAPFVFIRLMNKSISAGNDFTTDRLLTFNIIEYTFIQCALSSLFTTGKTLCYVSDGQNGLELVITGWLALPILIALSYYFDIRRENKIAETTEN